MWRISETNQRLTDQFKKNNKESLFSVFEILETHKQINREWKRQDPNTIIDTPNTEKQEHTHRNELESNMKHHSRKSHKNNQHKKKNKISRF